MDENKDQCALKKHEEQETVLEQWKVDYNDTCLICTAMSNFIKYMLTN